MKFSIKIGYIYILFDNSENPKLQSPLDNNAQYLW